MKTIMLSLLIIVSIFSTVAQTFEYVHPDFEIKSTERTEEECCFDYISKFNDESFLTKPVSLNKNAAFRRFDKENMTEQWRFYLQQEWTYRNDKLELQTISYLQDGNIMVLASYFDKKKKIVNVYGFIYNTEGEQLEIKHLTKLENPQALNLTITHVYFGDKHIIYSISARSEKKPRLIQMVWLDNDYVELKRHQNMIEGLSMIESNIKDTLNNAFYFLTKEQTTITIMGVSTTKSKYLLHKFDLQKFKVEQKILEFKDFTISSCQFEKLNNKIYLVGLAGPAKNSRSINTTYMIELDVNTLEPTANRVFLPITKEVVDAVASAKSFFTTLTEAPNAANFVYLRSHYFEERIIMIYENTYTGGHSGHYVVNYDLASKKSFQNYIPNIGWGNCITKMGDDGNLYLYFITDSKPFAKYLPDLPGNSPTSLYNKFLIEAVLDSQNNLSFRNIFNVKTDNKTFYISANSVFNDEKGLHIYLSVTGNSAPGRTRFVRVSQKK